MTSFHVLLFLNISLASPTSRHGGQGQRKTMFRDKKEIPYKILKNEQLFLWGAEGSPWTGTRLTTLHQLSPVPRMTGPKETVFPQPHWDDGGCWEGAPAWASGSYINLAPATPAEHKGRGLCVIANLHFNSQIQIQPKVVIKGKMKMRIKANPHSQKRRD